MARSEDIHDPLRFRNYFGAFFALAAANDLLTGFHDQQPLTRKPSGQRAIDALGGKINRV